VNRRQSGATRRARRALGVCVYIVTFSSAPAAKPRAECGARTEPWVSVEIAEAVGDAKLRADVLRQLRAGLAARGIDACPAGSATKEPMARVELASSGGVVAIKVTAYDALTAKEVSRTIDLSRMPRDSWPLVLALGVDEILKASWAELALSGAPPARKPVPAAVERTLDAELEPRKKAHARAPSARVGSALAAEWYAGGQAQLGIDARGALALSRRFSIVAQVGLRSAAEHESTNGSVRSSSAIGALGASLTMTEPSSLLGLDAVGRFELSYVKFEPAAEAGARATSGATTAIYAKAGLSPWLHIAEALRFEIEATTGAPLRTAVATDAGEPVTGLSGVTLALAVGVSGTF